MIRCNFCVKITSLEKVFDRRRRIEKRKKKGGRSRKNGGYKTLEATGRKKREFGVGGGFSLDQNGRGQGGEPGK